MPHHRRARLASLTALIALIASTLTGATQVNASAAAGSADWKQVSAGSSHTCGIRTNGRLYCWGRNTYGQLGDATTVGRTVPTQVVSGVSDWKSMSVGTHHTCALRSTGRLYCWGRNSSGQVGDGGTTDRSTPTPVGGWSNWTAVSTGRGYTCARRANGRLYCWGLNLDGQLGNGDTTPRLSPTQVGGGWTNWKTVSAGGDHTCGKRAKGRLYCWGRNGYGQLGDGTTTNRTRPREVARRWTNWTHLSLGDVHTCARRATGRLYCFGYNSGGALGDGTTTTRSVPEQVARRWTNWRAFSAGGEHTCARRSTGRLYCWGNNSDGHLGDGTWTTRTTPTQVSGGATNWSQVELGEYHSCAIKTSRRLYCWGYNSQGQLGDGSTSSVNTPTEVSSP